MHTDQEIWGMLPLWYVAFLLSLTFHEAAHALAGKLGGDVVAASQVTLNPLPHVRREPFGTVLLPIVSYFLQGGGWMLGWASTPYNAQWAAQYPRRAAAMSWAGPLANFALAAVSGVCIAGGIRSGAFTIPTTVHFEHLVALRDGSSNALTAFLSILFSINVVLGSFNLIPIPPLDGFSMITLVMNSTLRRAWFALGRSLPSWLGLIISWVAFAAIFERVFDVALGLLYAAAG